MGGRKQLDIIRVKNILDQSAYHLLCLYTLRIS